MYHRKNILVFGFHGCDEDIRNQLIFNPDGFKKSENLYDWLGNGMYFWENDPKRALDWAQTVKKKKPSVLGAIISLGNCLDFLENSNIELLKDSYNFLENKYIEIPQNSDDLIKRNLDCAIIENLISIKKENEIEYDSVRGVFFEGKEIYPKAGFREKNHIQIAVRNPNCIKGYFIPRELKILIREVIHLDLSYLQATLQLFVHLLQEVRYIITKDLFFPVQMQTLFVGTQIQQKYLFS